MRWRVKIRQKKNEEKKLKLKCRIKEFESFILLVPCALCLVCVCLSLYDANSQDEKCSADAIEIYSKRNWKCNVHVILSERAQFCPSSYFSTSFAFACRCLPLSLNSLRFALCVFVFVVVNFFFFFFLLFCLLLHFYSIPLFSFAEVYNSSVRETRREKRDCGRRCPQWQYHQCIYNLHFSIIQCIYTEINIRCCATNTENKTHTTKKYI